MQLRRKIYSYILENCIFRYGDKVLVACSAGADSTALLDILANLPELRLQLVVAHVNHLLRGDASDGDEAYVGAMAAAYNLPLVSATVDVAAMAKARGLSLEEAGREARYTFFQAKARENGCSLIALGHHLDDQAETVLMRLLRGAAGTGLTAMRPVCLNRRLARPLLGVSRTELTQYLVSLGISWRDDMSNEDAAFMRNRVRHELLPLLVTFNPAAVAALARTAAALSADEDLLEELASKSFARLFYVDGSTAVAQVAAVLAEPRALLMRLIRKGIAAVKGDLRRVSQLHLSEVEKLLHSLRPDARLSLPGGVTVKRVYGDVVFTSAVIRPLPADFELQIYGAGSYELPCGGTLQVEQLPVTAESGTPDTLFLSASALPVTLRYLRTGDRFTPRGMTGSKKLQDLFVDRKIPRELRRRIPLLLADDRIIWVCGVQIAADVLSLLTDAAASTFSLSYRPAALKH